MPTDTTALTKPTPRFGVIAETNGHRWTDNWSDIDILKGRHVCIECGILRNKKDNNKPCPGKVHVGLRVAAQETGDGEGLRPGDPSPLPGWDILQARRDIGILLACLDELQEATDETLDEADRIIVWQIRATYRGETPAPEHREADHA